MAVLATPSVRRAGPEEFPLCLEIRREVFVEEQGVAWDEELDGLDPECVQFLAFDGETVVGTARLRVTEEGLAKAERVAVRAAWRKRSVGRALMDALEIEAAKRGLAEMFLAAQLGAIPFYERLGYRAEGPRFLEAEIVHRHMRKPLPRR